MSAEMIGATGLAGRYATALFDLAETDRLLDQVAKDLEDPMGIDEDGRGGRTVDGNRSVAHEWFVRANGGVNQ